MNERSRARRPAIQRLRDNTRGSVLIEFAFALPFLLLVLMGILDFGLAFREYHVITNAAREGARMAVLPEYSKTEVTKRVEEFLDASGVTPSQAPTVTDSSFDPGGGAFPFTTKSVTVQVDYTFHLVGPIAGLFGSTFGTITLKSTSEMRTEAGG